MTLITLVVVFISMYFIQHVLGVIVLLGYFDRRPIKGDRGIYDASVIIPFRNEAMRIGPLLDSINQLEIPSSLELEFIFVNDHSTDDTEHIIKEKLRSQFKIVQPDNTGKKAAIIKGVEEALNTYIITWDADVEVCAGYFNQLIQYPAFDLLILPVRMKSKKMIGGLASIEFYWLQMLTYASARWQSPLLCNGANLVFKKNAFERVKSLRKDEKILSGDDLFLLKAIRSDNGLVGAYSTRNIEVTTNAPTSFKEIIAQRKRWSGKMTHLLDFRTMFLGALMILFSFGSLICIGLIAFEWLFIVPVLIKFLNEMIVLLIYTKGREPLKQILFVLVHQIWHPIYLLILAFSNPKDTKWRLE